MRFSINIEMFDENLIFWSKLKFSTKIEIFDQNWNFWSKLKILEFFFLNFLKFLNLGQSLGPNLDPLRAYALPYKNIIPEFNLQSVELLVTHDGQDTFPVFRISCFCRFPAFFGFSFYRCFFIVSEIFFL